MKKYIKLLFIIFCSSLALASPAIKEKDNLKLTGNFKKDTSSINQLLKLSFDFSIKNSEVSLRYAYQALELSEELGYNTGNIKAERYIGLNFASQGAYAEALNHLYHALSITEDTHNLDEKISVLNDIGEANMNFGEYKKAINYYHHSLELIHDPNHSQYYSLIISNLSNAYIKLGNDKESERLARQAIQLAKKENDDLLEGDAYRTLGQINLFRKNYSLAETYFKISLSLYDSQKDEYNRMSILDGLGDVYMQSEMPHKALQYYEQIFKFISVFKFNKIVVTSYLKASRADSQMGKYAKALVEYHKYVQLKDSTESVEKSVQLNNILSTGDLNIKQKHIDDLIHEKEKQTINLKFENGIVLFLSILLPLIILLSMVLLYNYNQKKSINEKLTKQKEELQALNSIKDRLFSIISHDLRSPLANLEAILRLMEGGDLSQDEVVMLSGQLTQNVQETSSMLDNLLQWSKSQMKGTLPKSEIINLSALAAEVVRFFQGQAEKKAIEIKVIYSENLSTIADKEMIRLVLRNLVANAIKFTPTGGTITISLKSDKSEIIGSVSDTGIGMEENTLTNLFSVESITTPGTLNEKGTGLGLILCKEFLERNQGQIWAESTLGKGSVFNFKLPLVDRSRLQESGKLRHNFI